MLYKVGIFLCGVFVRLLFRLRVEGIEHVPKGEGFILAANHRTNFDPLFVAVPLKPQVFFMAKAELFKGIMRPLLLGLGAFPIERGKGDTGAIDWAVRVIKNGGVLGMFPEGTRSPNGMPGKPKSGAAMLACRTHAQVVPCAICYGEHLKFRGLITVRYGKPITREELGFTSNDIVPAELKEASRRIMGTVVKILEENGCVKSQ